MYVAKEHGADRKQINKKPSKFLRVTLPEEHQPRLKGAVTIQYIKWFLGSQASMAGSA